MQILEYENTDSGILLLQPVDEHDLEVMDSEVAWIKRLTDREFGLLAFEVSDWNRELSPWEAPAVFGKNGFAGEAAKTLDEILGYCTDTSRSYYIGGYSLAGLFALWASYQSDVFAGVAAASPSMWFPGFEEYMKASQIKCPKVYLSLGDKEERTKNPVMSSVGSRIRRAEQLLRSQNVCCTLEWNSGNHFRDSDLRTAKAFAWLLQRDLCSMC